MRERCAEGSVGVRGDAEGPAHGADDGGRRGRWEVIGGSVAVMWSWWRVAVRLSMTATSSAPPICSSAPLVAEPTPVCSRGSELVTDAVAHGMTRPGPTPSRIMPATVMVSVELTVTVESCQVRSQAANPARTGEPVQPGPEDQA